MKRQKAKSKMQSYKDGQTMIVTVMLISSAVLGATTLAALLVLFQLRQSADAKSSTQAIFAADSGIECVLYEKLLSDSLGGVPPPDYTNCGEGGQVTLDNGAIYTVTVDSSGGNTVIKSVGKSDRASRAFEITF